MALHSLKAVQVIPVDLETAWNFFSTPSNLASITPAHLGFRIISEHHGEKMYPGQIIEYRVSPIAGIKLYWMTEITHVEPMRYFVDEQRYGPYAMWHHQHFFREVDEGVEMTDIVHYKNPMGFIGRLLDPVITAPRLKEIFEYRRKVVEERFGKLKVES